VSGDAATVTVKIYAGDAATGSPVSTFSTSVNPSTGAFSVQAPSLVQGRYTVQVSQADSAGNTGASSAVSYKIYNTIAGDANGDGTVNFADFVIVSNNYGKSSASGPAVGDFDFDGQVNFADFVILSNNYGKSAALTMQSGFVMAVPTGTAADAVNGDGVLSQSATEDAVGTNARRDARKAAREAKQEARQAAKEARHEAKAAKGKH
jgi:hypothetical protein